MDNQFQIGKAAVQQRLEVPMVLHPFGQGVADDHNAVAFVQFQAWLYRTTGRLAGSKDQNETGRAQPGRETPSPFHRVSCLSIEGESHQC
jgi:hypothetical protein